MAGPVQQRMATCMQGQRRSCLEGTPMRGDKAGPSVGRPLRILIEVVHPADVLFFYNPIRELRMRGCTVCIASREKDVTTALLREFGLEHDVLSAAGSGLAQLGWEMLVRDRALWKLAGRFGPDVMAGFGGMCIAHIGALRRVPTVGFYDTDKAWLQQWLTIPFIGWQYFPQVYDGPASKRRSGVLPGLKESSYLHPDNFRASRERAMAAGLDPERRNFLVRTVSWNSSHDVSRGGLGESSLRELVAGLEKSGRVHLSSEGMLSKELACHAVGGRATDFHHLMAHCDLVLGESATVAAEAAMLKVPSIYWTTDRRSYTDDLARRGLLACVRDTSVEQVLRCAQRMLSESPADRNARYDACLNSVGNLSVMIADAIEHHALHGAASSLPMQPR